MLVGQKQYTSCGGGVAALYARCGPTIDKMYPKFATLVQDNDSPMEAKSIDPTNVNINSFFNNEENGEKNPMEENKDITDMIRERMPENEAAIQKENSFTWIVKSQARPPI